MAASRMMVPVACGRPFAQDVLAPELDRVHAKLARQQVGMALVGPHELRNAESAQRTGRRKIGVERVGADGDVLDVVGTWRGKAGLLRDARADVGVGAAVPPDVAVARHDPAVPREAAPDAEGAGVLGDGEELLLHRQRHLDRLFRQQGKHGYQGFELDVELGAEAAAEERHAHAHPVLGPA
jgi:hypothetical protein